MPSPCRSERQADRLIRPGGPKLFNDLSAGLSAGLGYGLMASVMTYGAVLVASRGEAAWYRDSCPEMNAFILDGACIDTYGLREMRLRPKHYVSAVRASSCIASSGYPLVHLTPPTHHITAHTTRTHPSLQL